MRRALIRRLGKGARPFFSKKTSGPLEGLTVLDMTRVLAGPSCTQVLGDLGAEVIKIEKPGAGDDTRQFAPPFLPKDKGGGPSDQSAYFAGQNRNKLSVAVNHATQEGREVIRRLLKQSDILVENFKTGTLEKHGLGYNDLKSHFPKLVYCSITGFGHSGPYKHRPGYDLLMQAMGGFMSVTGEPKGEPMKVGSSVIDLMTGLHGVIGILAALRHASLTGEGQHIDIGMLDVTVAMLGHQATNYLSTGKVPERLGNFHPNVVPYQVMPSSDGHFILGVANDLAWERFLGVAQQAAPHLVDEALVHDPRFKTSVARVQHREATTELCNKITRTQSAAWWLQELEAAHVGCSPVLNLEEVFANEQVVSREMVVELEAPGLAAPAKVVASPFRFDRTPVSYRRPWPLLGEHTAQVLQERAGYSEAEIRQLQAAGAI